MNLLTYNEAAARLRIAPITLRKKVCAGEIPHLKPFGKHSRTYFLAEDLDRLLLESRQGGDTESQE